MGVQSLYLLSVILHIPQSRVLPSPSFLCTCLPHLTAISFHLTLCPLPLSLSKDTSHVHIPTKDIVCILPEVYRLHHLVVFHYLSIYTLVLLFRVYYLASSKVSIILVYVLSRYSPSSSISFSLFIPPSEHSCLLVQQPCIIISHKIKQKQRRCYK